MRPNIAFEIDSLGIIKAMVRHGLGYTVLTFGAVYHEVADGSLTAAPIASPAMSWTLCMASRVEQGRSRAMIVMRQLVIDVVRDIVDKGIWRGHPRFSSGDGPGAARKVRTRRGTAVA